ncbi:phosphatase PAP2 family protein [Brevundimonas sp. SORGH_AS_0993]|uniref:acid phosphatase n=1 Tax=Brevundimonas sp. SORGH_AS_0993 TaxID=3041794 RepID=UPI00277E15AF|nr:phosphatase PAP2 family protein [Brevundimonas sp. SORGH_AS_0993]MDQ1153654.1 acid phosphatase (class A) [Brevundimonas sp. SORGH_AS_0993]
MIRLRPSFSALAAALPLGLAVLTAGCAGGGPKTDRTVAETTFWQGFRDHPHGYLTAENAPNAADFLPPPPAEGSLREQVDIAAYRALRALEGSERWAIARADAEIETPRAPHAFDCALGFRFEPEKTPTLTMLLGRMLGDLETIQTPAKRGFFRKRPFVVEPLPICIAPEAWLAASGSYPSGHSALGWAWALVLAEMAPDRADPILRRGLAYGESRAVCGVHYVSDVEAGRIVGAALVARLKADPAFQADFARAREEFDAARAAAKERTPACAAALTQPIL